MAYPLTWHAGRRQRPSQKKWRAIRLSGGAPTRYRILARPLRHSDARLGWVWGVLGTMSPFASSGGIAGSLRALPPSLLPLPPPSFFLSSLFSFLSFVLWLLCLAGLGVQIFLPVSFLMGAGLSGFSAPWAVAPTRTRVPPPSLFSPFLPFASSALLFCPSACLVWGRGMEGYVRGCALGYGRSAAGWMGLHVHIVILFSEGGPESGSVRPMGKPEFWFVRRGRGEVLPSFPSFPLFLRCSPCARTLYPVGGGSALAVGSVLPGRVI